MKIFQLLSNRKKVLGQNERNLIYIQKFGNKKGRKIADDKLLTKKILIENDIPNPKLISVIANYNDFKNFDWDLLPKSFVIKPVHGVQGGGIEIFYNRDKDGNWIKSDGSRVSLSELKLLTQDILDGRFSINNEPDQVFFEERIRIHEALKNYSFKGTPDIRIIVFNSIPIMAYVRFPTAESKGKANMILGAVGTGIDISNGVTTTSTYGKANGGKGAPIEFVKGTRLRYQGIKIPEWDKILFSACKTIKLTGLKYAAADFLLDNQLGPVIVELSARPGLSIQIVNRTGLAWRLSKVKGIEVKSISHGIRLGKELFGGEVESEIEKISGKEVISNLMPVKIFDEKQEESVTTLALIDTSRRTTVLDFQTAQKLGLVESNISEGEFVMRNIKFKLGSQIIDSDCKIVSSPIKGHKICVGRKDLTTFIIDIKRVDQDIETTLKRSIYASQPKTHFSELDKELNEISRFVSLIPKLRPVNFDEEQKLFFEKNFEYDPQFIYKQLRFDTDRIIERLNRLNPDDSEIGLLYSDKISELRKYTQLIEYIGVDSELFTSKSIELFGGPKKRLSVLAKKIVDRKGVKLDDTSPKVDISFVELEINKALKEYSIESNIQIGKDRNKSNAVIGKSSGKIKINGLVNWTENKLVGMIFHEIYTHLLRRKNGLTQQYKIFDFGSANYIKTEEGLATLMKYMNLEKNLMAIPAMRYLSINQALRGSFQDVFSYFNKYFTKEKSFKYTFRVKRGLKDTSEYGAFTKDQYFAWAIDIAQEIIKADEDKLPFLFAGKGSLRELVKFATKPTQYPEIKKEKVKLFLNENGVVSE